MNRHYNRNYLGIKEDTSSKNDYVLEAITKVFGQFDKVISGACLRPSVTFIIFFIHELAKAPKTKHSKELVDMLPSHLVIFFFFFNNLNSHKI